MTKRAKKTAPPREPTPPYRSSDNAVCMRCGATGGHLVVPEMLGTIETARIVCREDCAQRPWTCPKCEGRKVPCHSKWCPVEHPEIRAAWEARRTAEANR